MTEIVLMPVRTWIWHSIWKVWVLNGGLRCLELHKQVLSGNAEKEQSIIKRKNVKKWEDGHSAEKLNTECQGAPA